MKTRIIIFSALLAITLNGCTYRINSIRYHYQIDIKKNDLFYHIPKTIIILTINYKITEKTIVKNGIETIEPIEYGVSSLDVQTMAINDPSQLYIARGKNISHQFFLKENTDFKFNEKGIIQSVESEYEDKSLETVGSTLKGISTLVKTITLSGKNVDSLFIESINSKINIVYSNLLNSISVYNDKDITKYKNQLKGYHDLLKQYKESEQESEQEIIKETEKSYTLYIDPDQLTTNSGKKEFIYQPINLMPEVKLQIELNNIKNNKSKVLDSATNKSIDAIIPGLVYNIPASLKTVVTVSTTAASNQSVFQKYIDYAQYGNLGVVPVSSKLFANRKTVLEFNSTTGTLISYKTESGSSSENLGKTVENGLATLKETVSEIKYDLKIDALKKEKEIKDLEESLKDQPTTVADSLQNSLELLKLQLEIQKLQKEIDELNNPK